VLRYCLKKKCPNHNALSFPNVVTADETLVNLSDSKREHQNKIWATKSGKRPCIVKTVFN
jgi:hypothetical protein